MRSRLVPGLPRRQLERVDLEAAGGGLPPSLVAAIEAEGGLWEAGDGYTEPDEIVQRAREVGAVALRLDVRHLGFIEELPGIRYLHLRSDGMPPLDPLAALHGLRALIIETRALRGNVDLAGFPDLRWLRIGLGGKGGAALLPAIAAGLPKLEWLAISEVKARTAVELVAKFPSLRSLSLGFADYLRELGPLASHSPH